MSSSVFECFDEVLIHPAAKNNARYFTGEAIRTGGGVPPGRSVIIGTVDFGGDESAADGKGRDSQVSSHAG